MLSNRLYYRFKPYLPWSLRMGARRIVAQIQRRRHAEIWPINEAAGRMPAGWPGWPDGKKFALVLTHDVEGPAGLAKCRQLMELEQKLGFRSAFNFIPEGDYRVAPELRAELVQNGFEVGVHDLRHDGKLYWWRSEFAENARGINGYLKAWNAGGFRSGFMLHNRECLHELDILYDASTFDTDPFEPQPDGVGTIFPFWVPRPSSALPKSEIGNRKSEIRDGYVELPYTLAQDSTLFLVLREHSPEIWFRKLDWVVQHGGMALVNVHPDYLRFPDEPASLRTYPVEFYVQLLKHIRQRFDGLYWQPLPKAVADFVAPVRQVDLLRDGEGRNGPSGHVAFRKMADEVSACGRVPDSSPVAAKRSIGPADSSRSGLAVPPPPPGHMPDNALGRVDEIGSSAPARKSLAGKHVAVVVFSYYPSDPRPRRAAEALAQEGAGIDYICLRRDQAEPGQEASNGLNIFRVPLKRRRGSKVAYLFQYSVFISAAFVFLTRRSFRRRHDLVHVHNMPDILVFSALIPKLLGAKIILDLHDPMPELMETIFKLQPQSLAVRFLKQCEKWSIRFADLVLTPNVAFKRLFDSRSCPPDKLQIVMNTPNEETFDFRPLNSCVPAMRNPDEPFTILYHGSLVARHGLDLAIDALEIVRKSIPGASIVICGESTPYFEQVLDTARQRGLQDAVHYLGMRNQRQIVETIAQCDLGVIPNRRSVFTEINMPTRIFEYLALGKPVIAPRTAGIRDYFADDALLFFEPDNTADLADKIVWSFRNAREMAAIVQRGQAVYQQHRWSEERERLISLVTGLFGKPSRPREPWNSDEPGGKSLSPSLSPATSRPQAASEAAVEASGQGDAVAHKR